MGVKIEAVATSVPEGGGNLELLLPLLRRHRHKGALALADEAAKKCLNKANRQPGEVGLLINVGIYRDKNLGEPALASLIQEDIGANPGGKKSALTPTNQHGTFSFDLANGACGVINAFHLLDRFTRSGILELGMIVASDTDPSPGNTKNFHHPAAGGAVLLSQGKEGEGFQAFHFENFPEFEAMQESRVSWHTSKIPFPFGWGGKNVLQLKEEPGYATRCVECAELALNKFLKKQQLHINDIDLMISSQYPPEFPDRLEQHLKLPGDHVARVSEAFMGAFSAAPLAGIEAAMRSGRFQKAQKIVFITVSAGISVGLALYEQTAT
jgi:3-oxoacyl-[acyl-carrier-protein] synthase-3